MSKRQIKSGKRIRANFDTYLKVLKRWNDISYPSRRQLRQRLKADFDVKQFNSRRLKDLEKRMRSFYETHTEQCNKEWSTYYESLELFKADKGEQPEKPSILHTEELMNRPSGDTQVIQLKDQHEHGMMLAPDDYIQGKRIYLVTSGQIGADANDNMWQTFQTYEKYRGTHQTAILAMTSTYGRLSIDEDGFIESTMDDIFNGHIILDANVVLNNNVELDTLRLRPTLGGPLVGLGRIRGKKSSVKSRVFAHPKQELEYIGTPIDGNSRLVASTGSCTYPNYSTNKLGQQDKTGEFAQREHVFGGYVIEIENDEVFHIRPIRVDGNGCFSDVFYDKKGKLVAKRFTPNGVEGAKIPYALLGDSHFACTPTIDMGGLQWGTDPKVFEATYAADGLINQLQIPLVGQSDTMDAHSMSHHDEKDSVLMERKYQGGMLDMQREFDNFVTTYQYIFRITSANFLDIAANHSEHPYRYISEERFTGKKGHPLNAINKRFGTEMWLKLTDPGNSNNNVAEIYAREKFTDAENDRVIFTKRKVSLVIEGVNCGMHGDGGVSGSRWSDTSGNNIGILCMVGHRHKPGIKGCVFTVGTSTYLGLAYTGYLGAWMNTHGLIFKSYIKDEPGQMMLINLIEGRWAWDPTKNTA